ncbi:MAG: hypothetical protein M0Z82_18870 [Actinomycetota bacterium]|nr:hypothetical protein [Actinomycetota bacterium]
MADFADSPLPSEGRHVVVLGAGFSRAASNRFLLANELGARAWKRVCDFDPRLAGVSPQFSADYPFETLLSLLAERQPYLRDPDNTQNRERFERLVAAIADILLEAQSAAIDEGFKPWFFELLSVLHHSQAVVISFNYDLLIEFGLLKQYLPPLTWTSRAEVLPTIVDLGPPPSPSTTTPTLAIDHVLRGLPARPPGALRARVGQARTFRLLKLHGSLDWWWTPENPFAPVVRSLETTSAQLHQEVPGAERFIVPPLALKSAYYRNPVTRQLWQDAYDALQSAERISLVGYSLPPADLIVGGLLEQGLRNREVVVDVVNTAPDPVCARVRALGGPTEGSSPLHVTTESSPDTPVVRFVDDLKLLASSRALRELRDAHLTPSRHDLLSVTYPTSDGQSVARPVVDANLEQRRGTLVLRTENHSIGKAQEDWPDVERLNQLLTDATAIIAESVSGERLSVVDFLAHHFDDPNAIHQLQFCVAGQLRR